MCALYTHTNRHSAPSDSHGYDRSPEMHYNVAHGLTPTKTQIPECPPGKKYTIAATYAFSRRFRKHRSMNRNRTAAKLFSRLSSTQQYSP